MDDVRGYADATLRLPQEDRPAATSRAAEVPSGWWVWFIYAATLLGLAAIAYYNLGSLARRVLALEAQHQELRLLVYPTVLWMAMGMLLLAFRTIVWMFYRPVASVSPAAAPSLTVIIPAYNEGAMVLQSIRVGGRGGLSARPARDPGDRRWQQGRHLDLYPPARRTVSPNWSPPSG